VGKSTILALDPDTRNVLHTDKGDLTSAAEREKVLKRLVAKLGVKGVKKQAALRAEFEKQFNDLMDRHRRQQEQAAAGSPEAAPQGAPGERTTCSPCSQYVIEARRTCRCARGPGGEEYTQPLCNFVARITREEVIDDGSGEDRLVFAVEGALWDGTPLPLRTIPAADFPGMAWPIKEWGLEAVVFAGQGTKDHLRVAIQEFSRGAERHRIYKHTGWRRHDGGWLYLHAGGAIGTHGTVLSLRVELDGKLAHYHLPDPPSDEDLAGAVRADLRLLGAFKPQLIYPLLGAVYRAALGAADCSVALIGQTGLGKSELGALAQQHFGPGMQRLNLPGSWSSTANALESLAFLTKDALLLIDDFKPGGSKGEIDQLHAKADRVLRAQGNSSARQRCWADGTVRADRPPRGLIIMTGEDQVRGESLRARQLPLLVRKGDIDVQLLTPYQQDAARGVYAQTLAAFLRWLAPQYEAVRLRLREEHAELRNRALGDECHPRTPGIVADLALGLNYFLDFARAAGVITADERARLAQAGWQALLEAAADQAQEIQAQDPARRFLELVAGVITSERAHLAARDGREPDKPAAWG
jgi:hypothetical protein